LRVGVCAPFVFPGPCVSDRVMAIDAGSRVSPIVVSF
jgi:hypothetical protein